MKAADLALFSCIRSELPKAVNFCIKHGADPNAIDSGHGYEQTALHAAACEGNEKITRLLLEAGANPNARDKEGATPLHIAVQHGNAIEVAIALIEKGADVNAQESNGQTPLHRAANYGHKDACRILVERGANKDIADENGRKAIDQCRNDIQTMIVVDPLVVVNPVCRSCHLENKALLDCQKLDKLKRESVRHIHDGCPFHLELVMQTENAKIEQAKRATTNRRQMLETIMRKTENALREIDEREKK
jgi:hypothetical protein